MKYYEIRCNPSNTKAYLKNTKLLYDGDFNILKYFNHVGNGLYIPEFRGMCDSITYDLMIVNGFNEILSMNFDWVLNDSDHRKDVRVLDERTLTNIISGKSNIKIVNHIEHLSSEHPISLKQTYILATEAYHKLGDISRKVPSKAIISEADDDNYYGQWCEGYGFINVRFPKKTSEIIKI